MMFKNDYLEKHMVVIQLNHEDKGYVRYQNNNIRVFKNGKAEYQVSCYVTLCVCLIGDTAVSTVLLKQLAKRNIPVFILGSTFKVLSEAYFGMNGNYMIRARQYAQKNSFDVAKKIVADKIRNQAVLLGDKTEPWVAHATESVFYARHPAELRGIEGLVAKQFFHRYFSDIGWYRRLPRAKVDIPNVLLDLGYSILFNFVDVTLRLFGFDTYKGVYHTLFFQRKSLVCDMMEPFRCLIDRQMRKSFNLKQVNSKDFTVRKGRYSLAYAEQQKYIRIFSEAVIEHKAEIYDYVRTYYLSLLYGEESYPLPSFRLKR